jgi:Holliday junction resolvase RusA-like endonuclease
MNKEKSAIFTFPEGVKIMGKPRMVRSDAWRGRKCVDVYWKYKDELVRQAKKKVVTVGDNIDLCFYIKIPESWSKNKKKEMYLQPHQGKPDLDNLIKGFLDALKVKDQEVFAIIAKKLWSYDNEIVYRENY